MSAWHGPRLGRAALAFVVAVVAAGCAVATGESGAHLALGLLAAAALVPLVVGLAVRWSSAVGLAVIGLGAVAVLGHLDRDAAGVLLVVAPLLVLTAELAHWSMDLSVRVADEPGVHRTRWARVLGATLGSGVLVLLVLGAARVQIAGDLPLDAVAVLAAVGLMVALGSAARAWVPVVGEPAAGETARQQAEPEEAGR